MENINVKVEGNKMTIVIEDLSGGYLSDSGKNVVVASSHGYQEVPGTGYRLNMNVIRKP